MFIVELIVALTIVSGFNLNKVTIYQQYRLQYLTPQTIKHYLYTMYSKFLKGLMS